MTYNSHAHPHTNNLLVEIEKAFRHVSFVCQEYFQRKIPESNEVSIIQPKNFNNYKYDFNIVKDPYQGGFSKNRLETIHQKSPCSSKQKQRNPHPEQGKIVKISSKTEVISKNVPKRNIPPPPKAPLSPYFTFYKQKKDLIKEEFPEMSVTELASAAARVWKSLSLQQKGPYNKKYFEQKRQYEKAIAQYQKKYPNYKQLLKKGVASFGKN